MEQARYRPRQGAADAITRPFGKLNYSLPPDVCSFQDLASL